MSLVEWVVLRIKNTPCLSRVVPTCSYSGGRTPGSQDSRRPRHPFPALMAGVSPGRVPVHTALKSRHAGGHVINLSKRQCQLRNPTVSALSRPAQTPVVAQQQACERQCPASKLLLWDLDCLLTDCTKELARRAQPTSTAMSMYCNRRISMVSEQ